jgi:hypothetical protein
MIELRDKETNEPLGTIDDSEMHFLVDELEEESDTIDMLEDDGAPSSLTGLLRRILGSRDGVEVVWRRA